LALGAVAIRGAMPLVGHSTARRFELPVMKFQCSQPPGGGESPSKQQESEDSTCKGKIKPAEASFVFDQNLTQSRIGSHRCHPPIANETHAERIAPTGVEAWNRLGASAVELRPYLGRRRGCEFRGLGHVH